MKNKTVACTAGVVFLLALSAMAMFVSAMSTTSATPYLDDSSRDEITVDRRVPIEIHRRVRFWIHEDPGSYEIVDVDGAGGIGSCILDIS
ncbi:MAG: hypothetical protein ACXABV_04750 [Candidatus Thorarchaeota archaeon]